MTCSKQAGTVQICPTCQNSDLRDSHLREFDCIIENVIAIEVINN